MGTRVRTAIRRWVRDRGMGPFAFLEKLNGFLMFSAWTRANRCPWFVESRNQLYSRVNEQLIGSGPMDYLEFGVFRGESIRAWVGMHHNPESRFYGFDSFTGLPEAWEQGVTDKGAFNVHGKVPDIDDARVVFVSGYFQDTLGNFLDSVKLSKKLLIHMDADLYSSTLYVLTALNRHIEPGTVIIFDEFYSVNHEFRAFMDFISASRRTYRIVAATTDYVQVAVEILS